MAAALLLATSSATRISLGTRTLNASRLGLPSTLPVFGGYSGSAASPIVPPLNASLACSDSCPDDIIKHQIQISAPTLPYRSFDDYDCGGTCGRARVPGVQRTIPTILYESDAYRATLYPDRGGKLASLYHKPTGRELLFDNPVWQPGRLGRLNAWTSGGIEWNWPRHGHTVFHMQPLWAVEVATSRGPVLRLFEFDREMNTTFQVDLWAAADAASAKEHDAPFYAHVKLTNPNDHDVDGYWWTNMAVPLAATSRVAYTDGTYAVVSGGSDGLALVPFPHFSETPSTMSPAAHANPLFNAVDHSYPAAYYTARENFIRPNNNGTTPALARALMGIVDTTSGKGALHAQSSELGGRKFWAWGNDWNDVGRMDFLSACPGPTDGSCEGAYLEMQAGVAPTQMQTFPLGARSSLEWTEAWSAWRAPPASVRSSYDEAVERARADFPATKAQFGEVDRWLRTVAELPASRIVWRGSAYGRLHELLTQQQLSPSLPFDAADLRVPEWRPWHELLTQGTFSNATLSQAAPQSFMVDLPWLRLVTASADKHGWTWLHHLHAGIACKQQGQMEEASKHLQQSSTLRPNVLASFVLGELSMAWALAQAAITDAGSTADDFTLALGRDAAGALADALRSAKRFVKLASLLASLRVWPAPVATAAATILASQPMRVAAVAVSLYHEHTPKKAIEQLLDTRGWAVKTADLVPMWYDAWEVIEAPKDALERVHTRRRHPAPASIDFSGAS